MGSDPPKPAPPSDATEVLHYDPAALTPRDVHGAIGLVSTLLGTIEYVSRHPTRFGTDIDASLADGREAVEKLTQLLRNK